MLHVLKGRGCPALLIPGSSLIVGVRLEKEGIEELNSRPHERKCKRVF